MWPPLFFAELYLKSRKSLLVSGQYRNAVASGRTWGISIPKNIAIRKTDPTLPRYGTDPIQVRISDF